MPTFSTGADGSIVANGDQCASRLAFIQQLKRDLQMTTLFTAAVGIGNGRVSQRA